jgi:hypothetical protein
MAAQLVAVPASSNGGADRDLFEIERKILELKSRQTDSLREFTEAEQAMWHWERLNPKPKRVVRDEAGRYRDPKADLAEWELRRRAAAKECKFHERDADWKEVSCGPVDLCEEAAEIEATTFASLQCKARIAKLDSGNLEILGKSIVRDLLALKETRP